jgi:uncharacterized RDD family membrane protein YckC
MSPVPREARPWQGQRAGLVTRLVAGALDAAIVWLVLLAGYFGLAALLFLVDPRSFSLPHAGLFFSLTAGFCVSLVYLTGAWAISGRTYGNLVMGLRVLGRGGRPLGLVGSATRALALLLLPAGVLWVAVSRDNRSLQDLALGTSVVYDWQPRGANHARE